jgi:alkylation response protein AidB-like acyl-CoA dehydrogenase
MPVEIPALRPLLHRIEQDRLIVATGSYGDNIRTAGQSTATIRIVGDRLVGKTHFTSIASQADLMTVVALRGDVVGFYVVELGGATIGEPSFASGPMANADTRSVEIDVALTPDHVITEDPHLTEAALFYSTAWFEALVSAAYLGAASRAIDEARAFAREVVLADGTRLADVDGAKLEIGRMVVQLKAALQIARSVAPALQAFPHVDLVDGINHLAEVAAVAKHHCTRAAEDIVQSARRFIGTRAMKPGSIIADLTGQVVFGPLHPKVAAIFERGSGEEVLEMESFVGLD